MKVLLTLTFVLVSIFLIATVHSAPAESEVEIGRKYDNFNVDEVLNNDRILKNYIRCMLDKGPCTAEGKDFRKVLPDALQSACSKCTSKQRQRMRKVTKHIQEKRPADWTALTAKFDPEGKYKAQFDEFSRGTD